MTARRTAKKAAAKKAAASRKTTGAMDQRYQHHLERSRPAGGIATDDGRPVVDDGGRVVTLDGGPSGTRDQS